MSYGDGPSSLEITSRRAPFEMEAALLLGQLLVGQSRIELAVQMYADTVAKDASEPMQRVLSFADTLADKDLRDGFVKWIVRARELQPLAQSLREARCLPDPRRNVVLLLAAPGGPSPVARSFTIADLQRAAAQQKELLAEFHRLCAAERGQPRASAAAFLSTQPIGVVEQPA